MPRSTARDDNRMRGPLLEKPSGSRSWETDGVSVASGSGSRSSFEGAVILNGIRTGAAVATVAGEGVGTGGPLEAGTLSVAGTPVPFGDIFGATGGDGAS